MLPKSVIIIIIKYNELGKKKMTQRVIFFINVLEFFLTHHSLLLQDHQTLLLHQALHPIAQPKLHLS